MFDNLLEAQKSSVLLRQKWGKKEEEEGETAWLFVYRPSFVELQVMIANPRSRRKGLAYEALILLMLYAITHLVGATFILGPTLFRISPSALLAASVYSPVQPKPASKSLKNLCAGYQQICCEDWL